MGLKVEELFEELYLLLHINGVLIPEEIKEITDPFERAAKIVASSQFIHPDDEHLLESHAMEIADFILSLSEDKDLIQRLSLFSWDTDE
ncbi:MAG: hypothetical protein AVO35_12700 [Candidatus Aegiribacteria sp. MLS_C]|nr:MAG: hypothetical protein AVO35_12700 [Candidatus Aegiribacteria sp. MLS_C]